MKIHLLSAVIVAITLLSFPVCAQVGSSRIGVVVIDAGHGGHDQGAHGKISIEKKVTLQIALKLGEIIQKNLPDVTVIQTRSKDEYLTLHERGQVAVKNKADVFISIHANSLGDDVSYERKQQVHGTESWVLGLASTQRNLEVAQRENASDPQYKGVDPLSDESYILYTLTQSATIEASLILASKIQTEFSTRAGRKSLGVKQANFQVLWETTMPAVLVETGYMSNNKEDKELNDPQVQEYIASAIFRAFRDYKSEVESISGLAEKQK